MIRVTAVATAHVIVDVRVDNDDEATRKAFPVIEAAFPGHAIDVKSLETVDDDETIPAGEARLA